MPPQLKPFDPEDFLESVAACGPQLTSQHKGNWAALYRCAYHLSCLLYNKICMCICVNKMNINDVSFMATNSIHDLYSDIRAFFKTPNFVGWLNTRREEANQKLRLLHLDMLCKAVSNSV